MKELHMRTGKILTLVSVIGSLFGLTWLYQSEVQIIHNKTTQEVTLFSNKSHPERHNNEVFVTNSTSLAGIGWTTARKGAVAYSTDGKPIGNSWPGAFPVFAKKEEIRQYDPKLLKQLEP